MQNLIIYTFAKYNVTEIKDNVHIHRKWVYEIGVNE